MKKPLFWVLVGIGLWILARRHAAATDLRSALSLQTSVPFKKRAMSLGNRASMA